jgi:hypothetical protein
LPLQWFLQGYLASLASTVESLQQGIGDMSAASSSLSDKLSQAFGESDQRKQDAATTRVSDAYKVQVSVNCGVFSCNCLRSRTV